MIKKKKINTIVKLRNKLILSCAALAAVATTAVSITFAWYTNNTEVTAKGVTGTTATSDQSVLMISKDDYNWGSKVDLNLSSLQLVPVTNQKEDYWNEVAVTAGETVVTGLYTRTGEGTTASPYVPTKITTANTKAVEGTKYYEYRPAGFYAWNQAENKADASATQNVDYLAFDLYFKSGTTDSLNVFIKKFDLVNTTLASGLPSKIKLNNTGLPVAATTYTVNMFRALTIDQNAFTTKERLTADAEYPETTAVAANTKVWDCQSLAPTTGASADSLGESTTYNAHQYYNAVKGLYEDSYAMANTTTTDDVTGDVTINDLASFAANTKYCTYNATTREYVELTSEQVTAGPVEGTTYYIKTTTVNGIDESVTNSETTRSDLYNTNAEGYNYTNWKLGVTGAGSTDSSTASGALKVTFIIYLDGWDKACFDACQGQNFTLDMEFVSSKVGA